MTRRSTLRWICGTVATVAILLSAPEDLSAQDSVDVIFRYTPPTAQSSVYVTGEFAGWVSTTFPMSAQGGNLFTRTIRLRIGGGGATVPGAYQYKFYYPGASPWPNDPLNHRVNPSDNNNSVLYVKDPTIYHLLPNQRTGLVTTKTPTISAYLYPKRGTELDTSTIALTVGTLTYTSLGQFYDPSSEQFSFQIPDPLVNGTYRVRLSAGSNVDSVDMTVQAGFVQITTRGPMTTVKPMWLLRGLVEDTSIHVATVIRNGTDSTVATVLNGKFEQMVPLVEGPNSFVAAVVDPSQGLQVSDSVVIVRSVSHAPVGRITFTDLGTSLQVSALSSTDPDTGQSAFLEFLWSEDPSNPAFLGVGGTAPSMVVSMPTTPGEYYCGLIATDPNGNSDTTRSFFTIDRGGTFQPTTLATVPQWVRQGRVYELFFKSLTPSGTIAAAFPYLDYLESLGVNILWVMPVMENASPINNGPGPGYNIKDFYKVAPEYGTNQDFKDFVAQAHARGMKVILDVTPNHTSFASPLVQEARLYRENSFTWNFYEHTIIPHNDNGLGQSLTADGFNYYTGFSDQLLNYDWSDLDARRYMMDVYSWWVNEMGLDGYRLDVYWGPSRRYGESSMGIPTRERLKHRKPDIYLLAEDAGVGTGTEGIYADRSGGVDSGYDWPLYFSAVKPFYSSGTIDNLNQYVTNFGGNAMGFVPGPNSSYLRFMENHDEERIAYQYNSYEKTMPVATVIFTAPGMPMIYSGQEVGFGVGITNFDQRRRGVIDWNAPGKGLLMPHYQKLAHIRGQFPAFSSQRFTRIGSGNPSVYTYVRPDTGEPGIVAVNFSAQPVSLTLALYAGDLSKTFVQGAPYYANDLYSNQSSIIQFSAGSSSLDISLPAYGSAIVVIADSMRSLELPVLVSVERRNAVASMPTEFALFQNYPNPFNPSTTIRYSVAEGALMSLKVYNVLGEEITTLAEGYTAPGHYSVQWNGRTRWGVPAGSGVYIVRFESPQFVGSKKIVLLR